MICTETRLTQPVSLSNQKLNFNQKQKLVACWKTVNGKLICQWGLPNSTKHLCKLNLINK